MSTNLAYALPTRPERTEMPHRHIEIVATRSQRKARPRLAYALVTMAALFAIFIAQLLLSIALSDGAYQISSLQSAQKELLRTEQALTEQLGLLGSTQHLAANAVALGMVPSSNPAFLRLSDGAVLGAPGAVEQSGCAPSCSLIANSLLDGVPIVGAAGAAAATPATATTSPRSSHPAGLPSPVTH